MVDDDDVPDESPPFELQKGWRYVGKLGRGGNGVVVLAERDGAQGAYKRLKGFLAEKKKPRARFIAEILALQKCHGLPGVIPLLDLVDIVDGDSVEVPWFVMEVAKPMPKALPKDASFEEIIKVALDIARALASIHGVGVTHRDIKPENCLFFNGSWCLGDFGLADFEGKKNLTAPGQKLGSVHYIAPEMLNRADESDGKAADVYSFAKLLWKMGTGQSYPLPGHQPAYQTAFSLAANGSHPRASLLDTTLDKATELDPKKRPTMAKMVEQLEEWLRMSEPNDAPAGPIKLDVSNYVDRMNATEVSIEARQNHGRAKFERSQEVCKRLREPINDILKAIADTLKTADFKIVMHGEIPENLCAGSINLMLRREDGRASQFNIEIKAETWNPPDCAIVVTRMLFFPTQSAATDQFVDRFEFIEGSPEEAKKVAEMRMWVERSLQKWMGDFGGRAYAPLRV